MTGSIRISKLDMSFALHAIYKMRWFVAGLPKHENHILLWFVLRDANDRLEIRLAADPVAYPDSIEDEIDGIQFHWVGRSEDIDLVRDNYCIDYDPDKKQLKLTAKEFGEHNT